MSQAVSSNDLRYKYDLDRMDPVAIDTRRLVNLRYTAERIDLNPRYIRGALSGIYHSPFKGRGMEFDEARPYQPGDDPKRLDWRVTARTGKPYTKVFKEERERPVVLWVDFRAPMFFATRGMFKSVVAADSAALVAWCALKYGDRLGGFVFSEDKHREVRPKRGNRGVLQFIHDLVEMHGAGASPIAQETSLVPHIVRLRRVARPGSLLFLISDFRGLDEQTEKHITELSRRNDVILMFVYDPLEQALPPPGRYKVSSGEAELLLDTGVTNRRSAYQDQFNQRLQRVKNLCRFRRTFFVPCRSNEDPSKVLSLALGGRLQHGP